MSLEIERKFLVTNDDWKQSVTRSARITDGLIASSNGRKVRVRIENNRATVEEPSRFCRAAKNPVLPHSSVGSANDLAGGGMGTVERPRVVKVLFAINVNFLR